MSAAVETGRDRQFAAVVWLMVALVSIYLLGTAAVGVRVGHEIAKAERNPAIAVGTAIVGHRRMENYVVQTHVPQWISASPTFWMGLHSAE
ncbi:MAG: hypothetical protein JOZ38_08290 [Candidatus Eremiobacteraeota bacterium]|nr:hypothetical protein [Candidatus Eremiobacteraeota bacterium]